METELSKGFKEAVARWLRAKGLDVLEVTGWDEYLDTYQTGCDTCGYGAAENEVSVYYTDTAGHGKRYVHYGLFGELLMELLNA